jgi:inosine-uridine nucleoside N-ribohydrolase
MASGTAVSNTRNPVIVDIDADPSDLSALLYLLRHPSISVKAITVSCGITYIDEGVVNVLRLLDFLGIDDIPVAGGSDLPLEVNHTFPVDWRQGSINFYGVNIPQTNLQPSSLNASQLIISQLTNSIDPMSIITTGPLTNIAKVLKAEPLIEEKIKDIHIMGGAVFVEGNVGYESDIPNYEAEWNLYIDPQAANIVFSSGIPLQLIPLDATNQVPQTIEFQSKLANIKQTPEADIAYQLYIPDLFFWDQLTTVAFTNPEVVITERYHIDIVVDTKNKEGQTISIDSEPKHVEVAINADAKMFEDLFLKVINNGVTDEHLPTSTTVRTPVTVVFIALLCGLILKKVRIR